ncbi:hypothetical protein HK105_205612 [Polyrhizophydium stewartii]|uniref:UDP-galactose transporter n=1 Tax=Polyrhizophydium stewartii TaxID=2732419 RepID=A0ABR4N5Z4_9FUNG
MSAVLSGVALVALVLQSTLLVLLLKYAQVSAAAAGERPYLKTTVILAAEATKFVCSLALYQHEQRQLARTSLASPARSLGDLMFGRGSQWPKLAVPAVLYFVQNLLLYAAAERLDSATFQVLAQSKLLTTAAFSALMLGRRLSSPRIIALVVLTAGIALVQLPSSQSGRAATPQQQPPPQTTQSPWSPKAPAGSVAPAASADTDRTVGLVYVMLASTLSGLSGVWFEKVVKESRASLWLRNMQLALFTMPFGIFSLAYMDGRSVLQHGAFQGFNIWTVCIVILQAMGGLIVAMVVKHADNIVKGFATCISIILSSALSVWLFGKQLSSTFLVGVALVVASTLMYARAGMAPHLRKGKQL